MGLSINMNKKENTINGMEVNLRTRLCELEACDYLLYYIFDTICNGHVPSKEFSAAIQLIKNKSNEVKLGVWRGLAVLSPVSPTIENSLNKN
jgi:hypothetical protein